MAVDFVSIGDPGNAFDEPDSNGLTFGRVDYNYKIAKYETTYGHYVDFLNAAAKSDPHELFHPGMQEDQLLNGIVRTGVEGGYSYALLDSNSADKPVTYVNFSDAVRFANWMCNGQGNGSTESGAYSITTGSLVGAKRKDGIITYKAKGNLGLQVGDQAFMSGLKGSGFDARSTILSVYKKKGHTFFAIENDNPDAKATGRGVLESISAQHAADAPYWIPTENEWYKAAYYNPTLNGGEGGYYNWATQSDSQPGNSIGDLPSQANIPTSTGFANAPFYPNPDPLIGPNLLTAVGSFTNSASYYGTFDQDGNVTEWNESIYDPTALFGNWNGSGNATRSKRGAIYYSATPGSSRRDDGLMSNDAGYGAGIRLASADENPVLVYTGVLSAAKELWPTTSPATGTIKLTLNPTRDVATYEMHITGLDFGIWYDGQPRTSDVYDDVNGMHFHHALPTAVGDVALGILNPNQDADLKFSYDKSTASWTITGIWTAADPSVVSLQDSLVWIYAGELYTNIHTEKVPLGEIRSQFEPESESDSLSNSDLTTEVSTHDDGDCHHHEQDHCCDTLESIVHNSFSGADMLTGMVGQDVFCYDSINDSRFKLSGRDIIHDFNSSEDLIDLRDLDADAQQSGHQGFVWIGDSPFTRSTPGELRYHHGVLSADLNGDSKPDFAIRFGGAPALTADNFLL